MKSRLLNKTDLEGISKQLPIYEKYVTALMPFPRGEDSTSLDNERLNRVVRCFDLWAVRYGNIVAGETRGNFVERHYRLIEACYRGLFQLSKGTKHTFHSLRLLRYIAHTFASLLKVFGDNICHEEKIESESIVASYVFLWEKHFSQIFDQTQKTRIEQVFVEQKRKNSLINGGPPINTQGDLTTDA